MRASAAIASGEKAAWSGFDRFYTAKSGGDSSDDEGSRWATESPGPSGRDPVKDADWEARDFRARAQAMGLLQAALDDADEDFASEGGEGLAVREEDQKSLRVGVVGSPNAGKSTLTNHLVRSFASRIPLCSEYLTPSVISFRTAFLWPLFGFFAIGS